MLAKGCVLAVLAPVLATAVVFAGGVLLDMHNPDPFTLWAFGSAVMAVVGFGTLVLLAAFGTIDPAGAAVVLVYLGPATLVAGARLAFEARR